MRRKRSLLLAFAVLIAVVPAAGPAARPAARKAAHTPGLAQLLAAPTKAGARVAGIATFEKAPPSAHRADALRKLGLVVQPLKHLRLALVYGTTAAMRAAVSKGLARDVYPNETLEWYSKESRESVRADKVPIAFTGKGVGVAVLDSGIDATHPDLADHVTHNVKFVGPEYLGIAGIYPDPNMPPGTLVVPIDQGPYNNSDLSSGHGTHVAGIVGADGTTTADQVGMAPDAELIGLATGDVAIIFTILAAFDYVIEHRDDLNIDVVNNSWGSSFRMFDPEHPIHIATKAVVDAGIVVAFSAGNSYDEMQVNPWSVAPWVISVGSGTTSAERSDFSSGGLEFDNSLPMPIPDDEHERFVGDRIGIYHPDVSAPGSAIVSSGTPTGFYVNVGQVPPLPGGTASASGTSMSSPHVAGLAALLLQARPTLTPDQVRTVMQVTSKRMRDNTPFWHAGYGWIDAADAVALVLRPDFGPALLASRQAQRDQAVQSERTFKVLSSDLWAFTPTLPVNAFGLEGRTFEVEVGPQTKAFKAAVSYPAIPLLGNLAGLYDWQIIVTDAAGDEVVRSVVSEDAGLSSVFVDLVNPTEDAAGNPVEPPKVTFGKWQLEVIGNLWTKDPTELLAVRQVNVSFSQLVPQLQSLANLPRFVKSADLPLYFQTDGSGGPLTSPEGCPFQTPAPTGGMAPTKDTAECQAAPMGYATNYGAGGPAVFTSEALKATTTMGGPATFALYLVSEADVATDAYGDGAISYAFEALTADGKTIAIAGGDLAIPAEITATATRVDYAFVIPPTVVPAGSELRLELSVSCFCSSAARMLYGGDYADAGVIVGVGSIVTGASAPQPAPKPKPVVKGGKQLPATGVGTSRAALVLLAGAIVIGLTARRMRRA